VPGEEIHSLRVEDSDAHLFQDPECGVVNTLDLTVIEKSEPRCTMVIGAGFHGKPRCQSGLNKVRPKRRMAENRAASYLRAEVESRRVDSHRTLGL
jgi:hypothetical protein